LLFPDKTSLVYLNTYNYIENHFLIADCMKIFPNFASFYYAIFFVGVMIKIFLGNKCTVNKIGQDLAKIKIVQWSLH
jgi:hypothetical protein